MDCGEGPITGGRTRPGSLDFFSTVLSCDSTITAASSNGEGGATFDADEGLLAKLSLESPTAGVRPPNPLERAASSEPGKLRQASGVGRSQRIDGGLGVEDLILAVPAEAHIPSLHDFPRVAAGPSALPGRLCRSFDDGPLPGSLGGSSGSEGEQFDGASLSLDDEGILSALSQPSRQRHRRRRIWQSSLVEGGDPEQVPLRLCGGGESHGSELRKTYNKVVGQDTSLLPRT